MTFFAFLGALSLSVLAFELLSVFQNAFKLATTIQEILYKLGLHCFFRNNRIA